MAHCLTVYSRVGCHLCDDMLFVLRALQQEMQFDVEVVDIDRFADLQARYNTRVPVLALGEQEICEYFLDKPALLAALQQN